MSRATLTCISIAVLLAGCAASGTARPRQFRAFTPGGLRKDKTTGAIHMGLRRFRDTDWNGSSEDPSLEDDLGRQGLFGFEIAYFPDDAILGYELSFLSSFATKALRGEPRAKDESVSQSMTYGFGGRLSFETPVKPLRLDLGLGIALLETTDGAPGIRLGDSAQALGGYAHAGLWYSVGKSFGMGVDYRRFSGADYDDIGRDSDFDQWALLVGWTR